MSLTTKTHEIAKEIGKKIEEVGVTLVEYSKGLGQKIADSLHFTSDKVKDAARSAENNAGTNIKKVGETLEGKGNDIKNHERWEQVKSKTKDVIDEIKK